MVRWTAVAVLAISALAVPAVGQPLSPPGDDWERALTAAGIAITTAGTTTIVAQHDGLVALDQDGATRWEVPITGDVIPITVSGASDGTSFLLGSAHGDGTVGGQPVTGLDTYHGQPFVAHVQADGVVDRLTLSDYRSLSDLAATPDGSGYVVAGAGTPAGLAGAYWIGRYQADGTALWHTKVEGDLAFPEQFPDPMFVDVDPDGFVAVWGEHGGELTVGEGATARSVTATENQPLRRDEETFVALVGPDGAPQWAHSLGSDIAVLPADAGLDAGGNLVAAVTAVHRLHVDAQPIEPAAPGGVVVVRFGRDGGLDWSREVVGSLFDVTVDVDADGTTHLAGRAPRDLTVGDLGDRVSTEEGADQAFEEPGIGLVGLDPDGTPRYARILPATLECCGSPYRGGVADVASAGGRLRVLAIGAVDPPSPSGSVVVGLDAPGPGPADAPHVGPELDWFHPLTGPTGPSARDLRRRGTTMAVSGEVPQYQETTMATAEGEAPLPDLDAFVASASPAGNVRWVRRVTTSDFPWPHLGEVDVAADGGLLVGGTAHGDIVLTGPGGVAARTYRRPEAAYFGSLQGFVARYSPNGDLVWSRVLQEAVRGQPMDAAVQQVETLADGGVLVAAQSHGEVRYGPRRSDVIRQPQDAKRVLLVRYDRNGTARWARSARGDAWWVDTDPQGRAVDVGTFTGPPLGAGADVLRVGGNQTGLYLTRRDAAGRRTNGVLLGRATRGEYGPWTVEDLAVDGAGRAWVVVSTARRAVLAPGQPTETEVPLGTTVLLQVRRDGRVRWVLPAQGTAVFSASMAPHPDGGMLWVLNGSGPVEFDDLGAVPRGTNDPLFVRVAVDGSVTTVHDGMAGGEGAADAVALPGGDVVVLATPRIGHFGANTDTEVHVHEEDEGRLSLLRYDEPLD